MQLSSEKFNVAWFKLSEFVGRKDKERAFSIYRLLAHSLPDEALVAQLEGDLLLAFNDEKAFESYAKAARFYEKKTQWLQAALVYEHMLAIFPANQEIITHMLKTYEQLGNKTKVDALLTRLEKTIMVNVSPDCMK